MLKVQRRRKRRIQKRWRPGMQALPPGKSDCSNSFRQPRNHYVHMSAQLTMTARLLLQRKRSAQTNGQNLTGSHGSKGLVWRGSLAYVFVGETYACAPVLRLAGFTCVCLCGRNICLRASPASMAAGPEAKVQDKPPQLKACPAPTIWNKTMTTPATNGKMLVNALYHSAVVSGLAAEYVRLGKLAIGVAPGSLALRPRRWHGRGGRCSRHGDQRHAN